MPHNEDSTISRLGVQLVGLVTCGEICSSGKPVIGGQTAEIWPNSVDIVVKQQTITYQVFNKGEKMLHFQMYKIKENKTEIDSNWKVLQQKHSLLF